MIREIFGDILGAVFCISISIGLLSAAAVSVVLAYTGIIDLLSQV